MSQEHRRARLRQQIGLLLGYRRVGPLAALVIAVNLGVPQDEIDPILRELVQAGRLVEGSDGRYVASAEADLLREIGG